MLVITSYSIHYTKLYEVNSQRVNEFRDIVDNLNPQQGMKPEVFDKELERLKPRLKVLNQELNTQRQQVLNLHGEDVDDLVERTTFVGILFLGSAILIGVLLSLTFARRILRRIQILSDSAERITRGDFVPPQAPSVVRDELDGSYNFV